MAIDFAITSGSNPRKRHTSTDFGCSVFSLESVIKHGIKTYAETVRFRAGAMYKLFIDDSDIHPVE
jgi:hypothetical protein